MATSESTQKPYVHPVDERPPFGRMFLVGLQHVLAMYAGAVAVPLVVGGALVEAGKLQQSDIMHLIVADLFVAGIASVIQAVGFWRFGARLPLIQGVSFVAVPPMITIGTTHSIQAIYGSVIAAGIFMILVAPVFSYLVKYFPALVTGTIMTVIGLSLISVPAGWVKPVEGAPYDPWVNFVLAVFTLVVVFAISIYAPKVWRPMSILGGVIAGTILAQFLGANDWSTVGHTDWIAVPQPMLFGAPEFHLAAIITMCVVSLVIMTETSADIIAIGNITGRRANSRILGDGLRADGLSTILGGIFNTFPYTGFAQNVGLISLSRVFSRHVITVSGIILIVLGLLPKLGEAVALIPAPVLGGAGVALFGVVAATGIRSLATVEWNEKRVLMVGVSIGVAMFPTVIPGIYDSLPNWMGMFLNSGIATGAILIIFFNLVFNREGNAHIDEALTEEVEAADELGTDVEPLGENPETFDSVLARKIPTDRDDADERQ